MISLRGVFYESTFGNIEDLRLVWAQETINLKPGLLILSKWTRTSIRTLKGKFKLKFGFDSLNFHKNIGMNVHFLKLLEQ